jgi:hypothetical protein
MRQNRSGDVDAGNLGIVQAIGGCQDDPRAEGKVLGRTPAADHEFKVLAFAIGQRDGRWFGATHGRLLTAGLDTTIVIIP